MIYVDNEILYWTAIKASKNSSSSAASTDLFLLTPDIREHNFAHFCMLITWKLLIASESIKWAMPCHFLNDLFGYTVLK